MPKQAASLPKHAPRKTGKRGVGPAPEPPEVTVEADKKPRQARLPGVEDPEIEELESAALDYAEIRDQRQLLTPKEVEAKEKLLSLMKAHDKQTYRHGNIEITRIVEKEKIKVKVSKEKEE
jgi:hypothetical protein